MDRAITEAMASLKDLCDRPHFQVVGTAHKSPFQVHGEALGISAGSARQCLLKYEKLGLVTIKVRNGSATAVVLTDLAAECVQENDTTPLLALLPRKAAHNKRESAAIARQTFRPLPGQVSPWGSPIVTPR